MQSVSALYSSIVSGDYYTETRVSIGEIGRLITKSGDVITFGNTGILTGASGADAGYDAGILYKVETESCLFSEDTPAVGACVSSEIDITMIKPSGEIVRRARVTPYVRVTDGTRYSEWISKGVYYVDTREEDGTGSDYPRLVLHGYDAMMFAEADYPEETNLAWPATDIDVVNEIAEAMEVSVDSRTADIMTHGYTIQYPANYSMREVLGYIASMYAGGFIMSDTGELRLVQLAGIPKETRYIIDRSGNPITFGGDRILV